MTSPKPATIANDLYQRIVDALVTLRSFSTEETLVHKGIKRDIEKLMAVEANDAWALKAMFLAQFGKRDEALYAAETACRLSLSFQKRGLLASNVCLNLAAFDTAIGYYKLAADPRNGTYSAFLHWLVMSGGVRQATEFCKRADQMNLVRPPELVVDLERAVEALDTLDEEPLSDLQIAEMLNVAGRLLLERQMLISANEIRVLQFEDGAIQYQFPIDVIPEIGAELLSELVDRICDLPFSSCAVSVGFSLQNSGVASEQELVEA